MCLEKRNAETVTLPADGNLREGALLIGPRYVRLLVSIRRL
jgi:hypothetical protein